jgi:hypothetical protein
MQDCNEQENSEIIRGEDHNVRHGAKMQLSQDN